MMISYKFKYIKYIKWFQEKEGILQKKENQK